jgi:uncharacterized protein YbjT (DUF2867 family)
MPKILTVFGATGVQGGSVVQAMLKHPKLSKEYELCAITRDTTKPVAKAIEERGIEVVLSVNKAIGGARTTPKFSV